MKKELKGFVFGVVSSVVVMSGVGIAAGFSQMIEVYPNNVTIAVQGVNTNIPSFTYNDSTYVQLRPVLERMDCGITYNEATRTVNTFNKYQYSDAPNYLPDGYSFKTVLKISGYNGTKPMIENMFINEEILLHLGFRYISGSFEQYNAFMWEYVY